MSFRSEVKSPYILPGDVAKLLGCSTQWITILADQGEFRYHRARGKGWRRIERASVEEYAARNNVRLDWSILEEPKEEERPARETWRA